MLCRNAWGEGRFPSTKRQNLPGRVGWAVGSKTSLASAAQKRSRAGTGTDAPTAWSGFEMNQFFKLSVCLRDHLYNERKSEFITSLFPALPALPSLKSLVSHYSKWITSFNNDVTLSITSATDLGSLKEKWDILEIFTAIKWIALFNVLFW